jgi:uncharacterized membrane protein (UPF0127 family)
VRAALAILLLLAGCARDVEGARLEVHSLVVGNRRIHVEVAANRADRNLGLMYRESLPADHGMLFIFPIEKVRSFWMKNTPLPLSIAFADSGGKIVHIADLEPHSTEPVWSERPAKLALEMNRGWFARRGVFVGHAIQSIPRVVVD